jgi:hypothetical protein
MHLRGWKSCNSLGITYLSGDIENESVRAEATRRQYARRAAGPSLSVRSPRPTESKPTRGRPTIVDRSSLKSDLWIARDCGLTDEDQVRCAFMKGFKDPAARVSKTFRIDQIMNWRPWHGEVGRHTRRKSTHRRVVLSAIGQESSVSGLPVRTKPLARRTLIWRFISASLSQGVSLS